MRSNPLIATIGLKPLQGLKPVLAAIPVKLKPICDDRAETLTGIETGNYGGRHRIENLSDDRAETLTGIETVCCVVASVCVVATIGLKPLQGLKRFLVAAIGLPQSWRRSG